MPTLTIPAGWFQPGAGAKYIQLADVLAGQINDGYLRPDEYLPGEEAIGVAAGAAKTVVRQALVELERFGLIERRNGVRARVIDRAPAVRIISAERYRHENALIMLQQRPRESAFTRGHSIDWDDYTISLTVTKERATPKDAELLGIRRSAWLWRRSFVKSAAGRPVEIQRSAITFETAKSCPWMIDPERQPRPGGTQRELADGGLRPNQVVESIEARFPLAQEKRDLRLSQVPVLSIERQFKRGGVTVEASRVVVSAATHRLVYTTDLKA